VVGQSAGSLLLAIRLLPGGASGTGEFVASGSNTDQEKRALGCGSRQTTFANTGQELRQREAEAERSGVNA